MPRRWSSRSTRYRTCNLHAEPHVQLARRLRHSTLALSQSVRYFEAVTVMQTSTHSDDPQRPYQCFPPPTTADSRLYRRPPSHRAASRHSAQDLRTATGSPLSKSATARLTARLSDFRQSAGFPTVFALIETLRRNPGDQGAGHAPHPAARTTQAEDPTSSAPASRAVRNGAPPDTSASSVHARHSDGDHQAVSANRRRRPMAHLTLAARNSTVQSNSRWLRTNDDSASRRQCQPSPIPPRP